MSDVAELATRFRLSDPKPTRCAACFTSAGPEVDFVDFDAAIDRGTFIAPDGAGAVLDSIDDLHLCASCVRSAAEVLGLKPELHSRQLNEIKRLELRSDQWEAYAKRLEATLQDRPERPPGTRRGRN
jgi:hypothetical protein